MMSSTTRTQPLAVAELSELGECPVWDPRCQRLYWVDIAKGELHWLDAERDHRDTIRLRDAVGFVCLTPQLDEVIVGLGAALARLDLSTRRIERFATLEPAEQPMRCNDGKPDPTGRLWVGTVPTDATLRSSGSLYSLDCDGSVRRELSEVGCSNGLAWNVARGEFYFIDSLARRIDRYRWDSSTGRITEPIPFARFSDRDGLPDGMCIDRDGNLWVAFWGGSCVRQIDGQTGATREVLSLPVERVTSCAFGGPDRSTLYITTAAEGLSAGERTKQPLAGAVFALPTETAASGAPALFCPTPLRR